VKNENNNKNAARYGRDKPLECNERGYKPTYKPAPSSLPSTGSSATRPSDGSKDEGEEA
jgi:hypothetical protein